MNADQKLIVSAYDDAIKRIYATLVDQYIQAGGVAAQEQEAVKHFATGVAIARTTRDRAVALLE
jgi:hypothetical protein